MGQNKTDDGQGKQKFFGPISPCHGREFAQPSHPVFEKNSENACCHSNDSCQQDHRISRPQAVPYVLGCESGEVAPKLFETQGVL